MDRLEISLWIIDSLRLQAFIGKASSEDANSRLIVSTGRPSDKWRAGIKLN